MTGTHYRVWVLWNLNELRSRPGDGRCFTGCRLFESFEDCSDVSQVLFGCLGEDDNDIGVEGYNFSFEIAE